MTVDQETPQHALDLVSFLPWLMQQKLKLGRQFHAQVHTGLRVCEVDIAIKDPETILVPLGERKAIVVQLDVTKCKKDRKITMWLDSKDFVPHRMMVEDAFIGWVEVLLTKVATVKPNFCRCRRRYRSKIFPGFKRLRGSSAVFTARIIANSAA